MMSLTKVLVIAFFIYLILDITDSEVLANDHGGGARQKRAAGKPKRRSSSAGKQGKPPTGLGANKPNQRSKPRKP